MSFRVPLCLLLRVLPLLLAGLVALPAQADPPARVARLNHVDGSVSLAPAGDNEWTEAPRNRPLTRGDRLWTDRGSRAELQAGSSALRLDGRSRVDIVALDDRAAQLSLTQGAVSVRVRSLHEGENFEIDTPNLAWRATAAGDYRIDVDPAEGTTRVTIHSGTGTVYGEGGAALPVGGGQQITFRGRALVQLAAQESPPLDSFDRWAHERNRREDQSIAARHVPREVVGYQQLDPHGQWRRDATHGAIWLPQGLPPDWAPYRHGHWDWIAPWGWTWIDDAPWGFAPFHYGRWTMVDGQWAWVPGQLGARPVYAPALVAFIGGDTGSVTWFPLAPGEAWQPPYRASAAYLDAVNGAVPLAAPASHAHQRKPQALASVAASEFHRGRPAAAGWLRIAASVLTNAAIVPPPPAPGQAALAQARTRRVPVIAPAAVRQQAADVPRPGAASHQATAPVPAQATAAVASQPRPVVARRPAATTNVRPAAPVPLAPKAVAVATKPARTVAAPAPSRPTARAAVPPRPVHQPSNPVASRGQAVRALDAKRALAARAEQARREQSQVAEQARRATLARRVQERQRAGQVRREALARQDEQLRRAAHARQVEQARRAAERDARELGEQRVRREHQARRAAAVREQADREAWQRAQQATTEQWRRDHEAWEQRQRLRREQDLRSEPRSERRPEPPYRAPEVWQRGIPLLAPPGPTS